jgi:hypothetical protein
MRQWLLAAALSAATALAVSKGGTLYVRTHEAKLLSAPDLKASPVEMLPLGAKVVWRGPSPTTRTLHEVEWRDGAKPPVTGFVFQSTRSPRSGDRRREALARRPPFTARRAWRGGRTA